MMVANAVNTPNCVLFELGFWPQSSCVHPFFHPGRSYSALFLTRNGLDQEAEKRIRFMRLVEFGEALVPGTQLTLFSDDKPDRHFTVIRFWMDEGLSTPLESIGGVPSYQVEDEEGRTHLLLHLQIEEYDRRWCLWRPDQAGIDYRSLFNGALVED